MQTKKIDFSFAKIKRQTKNVKISFVLRDKQTKKRKIKYPKIYIMENKK